MIRNNVNNKIYFGQTVNGFERRYGRSIIKNTHNYHLKKSFEKYGESNFTIVEEFDKAYSKHDLDCLEDMYIKIYKTHDARFGYNKKYGGANGHNTGAMKRVVCLNNGKKFKSLKSASTWCSSTGSQNHIGSVCNGKLSYSGKHPDTGDNLVWAYEEDYLNMSLSCIENKLSKAHSLYVEDVSSLYDDLSKIKLDIEYNKDNVKIILKNFDNILLISNQKPHSDLFIIKEDFIRAFSKIKLTKSQAKLLNEVINGGDALKKSSSDRETFYLVVDKIVDYFN